MRQRLGLLVLAWLRFWARLQLRKFAPDIIGITGSAGKTSCRNAVQAVLQKKYQLKVTGKANSESGIPLDILGINPRNFSLIDWLRMVLLAPLMVLINWRPYEKYIVEMGIDSPLPPKNMEYLLTILRPRTAIWLNALAVHSQNFDALGGKVIDRIADEKGKLIALLPKNGLAILNADQPEVIMSANTTAAKVMTFGRSKPADIRVSSITRNLTGTEFEFVQNEETAKLPLKYALPDYYGLTLAAALCINADEGNTLQEGCALLQKYFTLEPGRMTVFKGVNGSTIIDSSYNASAEPTIGALKMLAALPANKRYAVLGPMNELGDETENETERVRSVANKVCDRVWWSRGDLAVREIKQTLQPEDVILVKGSQNGVFLEMTVAALLADKKDEKRLCRRGLYWDQQRKRMVE